LIVITSHIVLIDTDRIRLFVTSYWLIYYQIAKQGETK